MEPIRGTWPPFDGASSSWSMSSTYLLLLLVNLVAHKHLIVLFLGSGQRSGLFQAKTLLVLLIVLLELPKISY